MMFKGWHRSKLDLGLVAYHNPTLLGHTMVNNTVTGQWQYCLDCFFYSDWYSTLTEAYDRGTKSAKLALQLKEAIK